MRFLLYSDLQLHPYKLYAKYVDGINDRLLDHIHVLDQIYEYALKNNIGYIFFGGDMFEARAKVDVIAAVLLAEWKQKVSDAGIIQVDVVGNHDLYDKSTLNNGLDLYKNVPKQHIITKPKWFKNVWCIPYMHRLDDMKAALTNIPHPPVMVNKNLIAIIHYGLYDVPMESHSVIRDLGYETEGQLRLSDLQPLLDQGFSKIFFGHFHITTAVTDKVHFIGTPLQHKWGEKDVDTRFLDVDTETGEFKAIETQAPRFIEFELDDIDPPTCVGNFVRVRVADGETRTSAIELLAKYGARGADALIIKKEKEATSRLGINLGMSFEEMGNRMVDKDKTDLDKSKLKNILYEALKQAAERKGI